MLALLVESAGVALLETVFRYFLSTICFGRIAENRSCMNASVRNGRMRSQNRVRALQRPRGVHGVARNARRTNESRYRIGHF